MKNIKLFKKNKERTGIKVFLKEILKLDKFITPKIIRFFYLAMLSFVIIYGISISVLAFNTSGFLMGISLLFVSLFIFPLFIRLFFEMIKLPYAILEELKKLNK